MYLDIVIRWLLALLSSHKRLMLLYGAAGDQIAAPALEEVKGSIGAEINKYDDVAVTENDGEEISNKARVLRLQSCQGFDS
jgi:hypothetical protein